MRGACGKPVQAPEHQAQWFHLPTRRTACCRCLWCRRPRCCAAGAVRQTVRRPLDLRSLLRTSAAAAAGAAARLQSSRP
eukprot:351585-Chlamydomonas_euryale.AAC.7